MFLTIDGTTAGACQRQASCEKNMTDTLQVQGEFAPAESSFAAEISAVAAVADAPVDAVTAEPNGFVELGLAPELVQAVADLGYTQPTSVQRKAIPLAMGSDASSSST